MLMRVTLLGITLSIIVLSLTFPGHRSFVSPSFLPDRSIYELQRSRILNLPSKKQSFGGKSWIAGVAVKCAPEAVESYLELSGYDKKVELQPLTAGFCNDVFSFHPESSNPSPEGKLVIKVFSPMAHIRATGDAEGLGVVDRMASERGLGPDVVLSHRNFTITTFVEGRTLEESDIHKGGASEALCRKLGVLVGKFHEIEGKGNRLLRSLEIMADGVGGERGAMWRKEISEVRALMVGMRSGVMCHGDLKPSNVMQEGGEGGTLKLIDFELSGGGWRGFDIYKLFRTGEKTSRTEGNLRAFLEEVRKAEIKASDM